MNRFLEHHDASIRFVYSCFDRIVLNAVIQPLQRPASIVWFFKERQGVRGHLDKKFFRTLSGDYHDWVRQWAQQQNVEIVTPPKVRRENWVQPYYQQLAQDEGVAVILKTLERANIAVSQATSGEPHIELKPRHVWQYYFYVRDSSLGPLWLRVCPYFPFNARICLNGHNWSAQRMRNAGIQFRQEDNAFLTCSDPSALQEYSDAFGPDILRFRLADIWLRDLVPYFTEQQRLTYFHDLFMSQVEYCTNVIFHRRVSLSRLHDRLLDLNRTLGRPDKMSVIYGRRISGETARSCRSRIAQYEEMPVLRCFYKNCSLKQYVRNGLDLRVEGTMNNTWDLRLPKALDNLPALREIMKPINERYLDVQQDVLETYLDGGQLAQLRMPTQLGSRRVPGLKLDDARLLAVMEALVQFAPLAVDGVFRSKDLHARVARALGKTTETYKSSQLRYDLSKLRVKGLVQKVEGTQGYRLTDEGYRVCLFFLKVHQRLLAPVTSATQEPSATDPQLPEERRSKLDRLYVQLDRALQALSVEVGLRPAA